MDENGVGRLLAWPAKWSRQNGIEKGVNGPTYLPAIAPSRANIGRYVGQIEELILPPPRLAIGNWQLAYMGKSKMIEKTRERVSRLCRKVDVSFVGRFFHFIWDSLLVCSLAPPPRYTRLPLPPQLHLHGHHLPSPPLSAPTHRPSDSDSDSDSDSVSLKISLLGDKAIGKTSFLIKYVGDEQQKRSLQMKGLTLLDKTLLVRGARISFTIWDVAGDREASHQIPMACKDAVAILFLFDLTSRPTLNSVVGWFSEARKWNQTALPILIGTKFDDFVRLPPDVQWTIVAQARAYARAMKATLFFSSARHNINVNKIFKFIMAKLFNLPWKVERNLTLGEPIIDFF